MQWRTVSVCHRCRSAIYQRRRFTHWQMPFSPYYRSSKPPVPGGKSPLHAPILECKDQPSHLGHERLRRHVWSHTRPPSQPRRAHRSTQDESFSPTPMRGTKCLSHFSVADDSETGSDALSKRPARATRRGHRVHVEHPVPGWRKLAFSRWR